MLWPQGLELALNDLRTSVRFDDTADLEDLGLLHGHLDPVVAEDHDDGGAEVQTLEEGKKEASVQHLGRHGGHLRGRGHLELCYYYFEFDRSEQCWHFN